MWFYLAVLRKCRNFAHVFKRGTLVYTLSLGYGVMVTLQILVLPFLVRVRVPQLKFFLWLLWIESRCLGYGVMVTLQILVLPFLVRVRIPQLFNSFHWRNQTLVGLVAFFYIQKSYELSNASRVARK